MTSVDLICICMHILTVINVAKKKVSYEKKQTIFAILLTFVASVSPCFSASRKVAPVLTFCTA